jgi:hypothetical protein
MFTNDSPPLCLRPTHLITEHGHTLPCNPPCHAAVHPSAQGGSTLRGLEPSTNANGPAVHVSTMEFHAFDYPSQLTQTEGKLQKAKSDAERQFLFQQIEYICRDI